MDDRIVHLIQDGQITTPTSVSPMPAETVGNPQTTSQSVLYELIKTGSIRLQNEDGHEKPSQTDVTKPHVCRECGKAFSKACYLTVHMRRHTGEKPYCCKLCGDKFTGLTALQRHELRHYHIRAYKCQTCDKSYVCKHELKEHEKKHSDSAENPYKKYGCDLCDKSYRFPFQLRNHRRVHTGERPVGCPVCGSRHPSNKAFKKHYRRVHEKVEKFKCETCEKRFYNVTELNRHAETHTTETPFECDTCGKEFRQKRYLQRHQKRPCVPFAETQGARKLVLNKLFQCPTCDRRFALEQSRDMHVKLVHNTTPT